MSLFAVIAGAAGLLSGAKVEKVVSSLSGVAEEGLTVLAGVKVVDSVVPADSGAVTTSGEVRLGPAIVLSS